MRGRDHHGRTSTHRPAFGLELLEGRLLLAADWPVETGLILSGPRTASLVQPSTMPASLEGKVDPRLWEAWNGATRTRPAQAATTAQNLLVPRTDQGRVQTYIHVAGRDVGSLAQMVAQLGVKVDSYSVDAQLIQAWVPAGLANRLMSLPGVQYLGLPDYGVARAGGVTSEGVAVLGADKVLSQFAAYGVDGAGIKVGVISDGAVHRANSQATGDLPASVSIDPARPGSGDEGTAMMEIVHDMAPGAQLYFSGPSTSVEMVASINWLASQGCNIIVDDLGFYGEPYFADGSIAQAAADVVASGITYVTAAGNDADAHYQAQYVQGSSAGPGQGYWHDFGGGDIGQSIVIPAGQQVTVLLQWSDAFGNSGNNYNLYLVRASDNAIIAGSTAQQNGSADPFEAFAYTNSSSSSLSAYVAINKRSGSARELELFIWNASSQQYTTSTDSVFGHAAVTSVIAAGAVRASSPSTVEYFSSQGPSTIYTDFATQTKITRQSLDGLGVDGVQTEVGQLGYFYNPFYGTSAAAPHVAGLAALILSANPLLTPAELSSVLSGTAIDLTAYGVGYDNSSGAGRFGALAAVYRAFTPSMPQLAVGSDLGASDTDHLTSLPTPTFIGTVPSGSFVHLYVDGVDSGSQQLAAAQDTYSITSSALSSGTHEVTVRLGADATTTTSNLSYASEPLLVTIDLTAPTLDLALSRKTHGSAGTFDLPLSLTTTTVEPRLNGPSQLLFNFAEPIVAQDGALDGDEFVVTNATYSVASINSSTLSLDLSNISDGQTVMVQLQGLIDLAGNSVSVSLQVGALLGDVNGNATVNINDVNLVKSKSGAAVDSTTFRYDVNANGAININDVNLVKSRSGRSLSSTGTLAAGAELRSAGVLDHGTPGSVSRLDSQQSQTDRLMALTAASYLADPDASGAADLLDLQPLKANLLESVN